LFRQWVLDRLRNAWSQEDLRKVEERVNPQSSAGEHLSDIFGKLAVLNREDNAASDDEMLMFTIPVHTGKGNGGPGARRTALLLGKLSILKYGRWITWLAASVGGVFVVFIILLSLIFGDFGLRLREQHLAFQTVDRVMNRVPVPYLRVDEQQAIVSLNPAFADLLGYPNQNAAQADLKARAKTWDTLLADKESEDASSDSKKTRAKGEAAKPYLARLWKGGQHVETVGVEVHAADVPEPSIKGMKRASFGFLLPPPEDGKVVMITSVRAPDAVSRQQGLGPAVAGNPD
jgi:PAS domain-containing protein